MTAAASVLFLRERAGWRILGGIALAVAGVLVLQLGSADGGGTGGGGADGAASGAGGQWLGASLIFAAVCSEAAYTLLGKRASSRIDPVLVAALAALISLPAFVLLAVWQWPGFQPEQVSTGAWLAVLWYGAGTLALGSWLWYAGVARAPGAVAAGFMGLMPASALILSYVLLGEPFRVIHLVGFAIVFASVLMIGWEHARMARASDRKAGE
ncbi:DMT family transporter [Tistrella bauzanensis]